MNDKKVLILGLGVTGKAALKYLQGQGATITVVDGKPEKDFDAEFISEYQKKGVKFIFNTNSLDEMDFDLLLTSPGVKPTNQIFAKALELGIEIKNDVTLFIEKWDGVGPIVGVTGSNGKSTIVSFIHKILQKHGKKSILVGNIGTSPLDYLSQENESGTVAIMELSSYQLENFKSDHAVDIAILANLSSNHLDRYHGKMSEYALAKLQIAHKDKTTLILDIDDEGTKKYVLNHAYDFAKEIVCVSLSTNSTEAQNDGVYTNENSDLVFVQEGEEKIIFEETSNRELIGLHNLYNIAMVLSVIQKLGIEIDEKLIEIVRTYKGLEHRIEKVALDNGVLYVNDSKSTSPDATRVALEAVGRGKNVILIAGGENKGMEFSLILPLITEFVRKIILLPGDAGELLEKQVADFDPSVPIEWVKDMQDAVSKSKEFARSGDVVLLSPSSSSLNTYKSFENRGEIFKAEVSKIIYN